MPLMDQRLRSTKLFNNVLASVAGAALDRTNRYLSDRVSSYLYPPAAAPMAPTRRAFRRRRMPAGRRYGRRRRIGPSRRRRASKRLVAGPGPYQKRGRSVIARPLNTNLSRNDYDSTRECVQKGVIFPNSTAVNVETRNTAVGDYPLASAKMFDYDEYKLANIQLVLTPLNLGIAQQSLSLADGADPYLYVIPRIHPDTWTSTPSITTIKSTPGVMRFHMLRRKPIVINLKTIVPQEETVFASVTGASYTIETPFKKLGWIHQPQEAGPVVDANYPNLGTCTFYMPQLAAGSFQPKWRIDYYTTVYLRGNRALIDV